MTKDFIYSFIKQHNLAVLTTISKEERPEAALVGFAISEDLELVFDTVKTSRKYPNLLRNPFVAVVIGCDNETTVQYEGIATELSGPEAGYYKEIYFDVYKDGRERAETWPHIVHFKITPNWIRYSNFNDPVVIEEMSAPFNS
jgi:general stress protein 26